MREGCSIALLLALTAGLFDAVPLERTPEAERAVQEAAADIPDAVNARRDGADTLSDEDRASVVEIGLAALEDFLSRAARSPTLHPRGL